MFPDATEPCKTNGGASGQEEFCDITLDKLVDVEKDMEATLHAHSSHVNLTDCEGGNLQRAFPLQFPCGFGVREPFQVDDGETKRKQLLHPRNLIDG